MARIFIVGSVCRRSGEGRGAAQSPMSQAVAKYLLGLGESRFLGTLFPLHRCLCFGRAERSKTECGTGEEWHNQQDKPMNRNAT